MTICKVQPHTHPKTENVTVISGTLHVGIGGKLDRTLPGFWAKGLKEFGFGGSV
jgi:quercetin dioxygenase-like cupin family protein